jgi:hypothetical protein
MPGDLAILMGAQARARRRRGRGSGRLHWVVGHEISPDDSGMALSYPGASLRDIDLSLSDTAFHHPNATFRPAISALPFASPAVPSVISTRELAIPAFRRAIPDRRVPSPAFRASSSTCRVPSPAFRASIPTRRAPIPE